MPVNLAHCHVCGGVIDKPNSFALYLSPGDRDNGRKPVEVHDRCLPKNCRRVSSYAYEMLTERAAIDDPPCNDPDAPVNLSSSDDFQRFGADPLDDDRDQHNPCEYTEEYDWSGHDFDSDPDWR